MAAAAAINGKHPDVRKYVGVESNNPSNLKSIKEAEFLTDPVLPSPDPITANTTEIKELPPAESPSRTEKFTIIKGIAAPLNFENVDTDMIIPKQFLKTLKRTGLGDALFYTLRKDPLTGAQTDFILNREPFNKAKILVVTGKNFGCGSSREHAPWSLKDFGIQTIIAPSFADIFRNNTMQNGMLPVALPEADCRALAEDAAAGLELEVDLEKQEVRRPGGKAPIPFETDPFRRHCLLNGLDDIALTLQKASAISEFEQQRSERWPWLDGFGYKGKKIPIQPVRQGKKMEW